jgi:hypothetical protein
LQARGGGRRGTSGEKSVLTFYHALFSHLAVTCPACIPPGETGSNDSLCRDQTSLASVLGSHGLTEFSLAEAVLIKKEIHSFLDTTFQWHVFAFLTSKYTRKKRSAM